MSIPWFIRFDAGMGSGTGRSAKNNGRIIFKVL